MPIVYIVLVVGSSSFSMHGPMQCSFLTVEGNPAILLYYDMSDVRLLHHVQVHVHVDQRHTLYMYTVVLLISHIAVIRMLLLLL